MVSSTVFRISLPGLLLSSCVSRSPLRDPVIPEALDRIDVSPRDAGPRLLPRTAIDLSNGLSIDEATTIAVIANPGLRALRANRGIAAAQVLEAGVLPNPELDLGADVPTFGALAGTTTAAHLGISWEVTALVTRDANVRASEANAQKVDLEIAWQEWQQAMEARLEWRRLDASERELAAAKKSEADLKAIADTLNAAASSGDATTVETSAARSALDEAVLARLAIEREHDRARRALARALGVRLDAPFALQAEAAAGTQDVPDHRALVAGLAAHRLDLLALKLGYESQEQRLRAAALSRFPRMTLGVAVARDPTDVGTVGASVAIALPVLDHAQGRVAVESATRDQLREEYAAREYDARADLDDAYAELALARAALATAEATLPHLEQLVSTYRAAFAQRLVDAPSVYVAVNSLDARRLDVLERRLEIGDLITKIELASGQLVPGGTP
jgi:outer membrane protein TolC